MILRRTHLPQRTQRPRTRPRVGPLAVSARKRAVNSRSMVPRCGVGFGGHLREIHYPRLNFRAGEHLWRQRENLYQTVSVTRLAIN